MKIDLLRAFVDALDQHELAARGAWMEDKGASVSLHFRQAADPVATGAWLRDQVRPAALDAGLRTRDGRMILELLPDIDVDKGSALAELVIAAGARRVLYVGDDHTEGEGWGGMGENVFYKNFRGEEKVIDLVWCFLVEKKKE